MAFVPLMAGAASAFSGTLMAGLSVASMGLSALGAIRQGQAANAAAQYNAQVANNNAIAVEQQTQSQAMMQARRASYQNGALLANQAASGIDSTEGSALDLLSQSATNAEMDRQNIIYSGRVKANSLRSQAQLDVMQGQTAEQNGYMSAAGTLLSAGSKTYARYNGAGSSLALGD